MDKVAGIVFFTAWLLCGCSVEKVCGCSVEKVCDDWRACVIFVIALIVVIAAAAAITRNDQ